MVAGSFLRNKIVMFLVSVLASLIILLQIISIYISDSFIDYKFYIHFNTRDLFGIIQFFDVQLFIFLIIYLLLFSLIYKDYKKFGYKLYGLKFSDKVKCYLSIFNLFSFEK